jgi:hypothetical protein
MYMPVVSKLFSILAFEAVLLIASSLYVLIYAVCIKCLVNGTRKQSKTADTKN